MRIVHLVLSILCACSTVRLNSDGQIIRADDAVPTLVKAAVHHTVAVYIEATCDHLERATGRGGGFWVTPRIVVTAGHAMEVRKRMFPDFAIVEPDGTCIDGQYGDWNDQIDVLFILAKSTHEGHLALAERLPAANETAYQLSFETRDEIDGRVRFSRRRMKTATLDDSKLYFTAKPVPREGDSGSPLVGPDGTVIGMAIAIGTFKDDLEKPRVGVYLSSLAIGYLLSQCAPCEEE